MQIEPMSEPKKRGRKPKRPQFRNKKAEDLDKFWFRKFRKFVRQVPSHCTEAPFNREFWEWFRETEPGAVTCSYKSYNLAYKRELVTKLEFRDRFANWLNETGRKKMYERFERDLAEAYCKYAEEEILNYTDGVVSDAKQLELEAEHFVNMVFAH